MTFFRTYRSGYRSILRQAQILKKKLKKNLRYPATNIGVFVCIMSFQIIQKTVLD